MKTFISILIFMIASTSSIMAQISDENQDLEPQEVVEENLASEKEQSSSEKKQLKTEKKLLEGRAQQRTIFLQKELDLNNFVSGRLKKIIIKYSAQANRVLQSNVSSNEKTRNLNNVIYFQNQELKKVLTVQQFYKYRKLTFR